MSPARLTDGQSVTSRSLHAQRAPPCASAGVWVHLHMDGAVSTGGQCVGAGVGLRDPALQVHYDGGINRNIGTTGWDQPMLWNQKKGGGCMLFVPPCQLPRNGRRSIQNSSSQHQTNPALSRSSCTLKLEYEQMHAQRGRLTHTLHTHTCVQQMRLFCLAAASCCATLCRLAVKHTSYCCGTVANCLDACPYKHNYPCQQQPRFCRVGLAAWKTSTLKYTFVCCM